MIMGSPRRPEVQHVRVALQPVQLLEDDQLAEQLQVSCGLDVHEILRVSIAQPKEQHDDII